MQTMYELSEGQKLYPEVKIGARKYTIALFHYSLHILCSLSHFPIGNQNKVSVPTKIVATFDVEHPILGTTHMFTT